MLFRAGELDYTAVADLSLLQANQALAASLRAVPGQLYAPLR